MAQLGRLLNITDIQQIATLALFNLCNDYEPAQRSLFQHSIYTKICHLFVDGLIDVDSPASPSANALVAWGSEQLTAETKVESADGVDLLCKMLIFLRECEDSATCETMADTVIALIQVNCVKDRQFTPEVLEACFDHLATLVRWREMHMTENIQPLTNNTIAALHQVASADWFAALPRNAPIVKHLAGSIIGQAPCNEQSIAAAYMLSEISTSDEACIELEKEHGLIGGLQTTLLAERSEEWYEQSAYPLAGLLLHLLTPKHHADMAQSSLVWEVAWQILRHTSRDDTRRVAVALLRFNVEGDYGNATRLLVRSSEATAAFDSHRRAGHMPKDASTTTEVSEPEESQCTLLDYLLTSTSSAVEVKYEVGRVIIAVLRSLHRTDNYPSSSDDMQSLEQSHRSLFANNPAVIGIIYAMIKQEQSPFLRTQGWFGLALMTYSPEGCACVATGLASDEMREFFWQALDQVTKKEGQDPEKSNAMIGVSNLLEQKQILTGEVTQRLMGIQSSWNIGGTEDPSQPDAA